MFLSNNVIKANFVLLHTYSLPSKIKGVTINSFHVFCFRESDEIRYFLLILSFNSEVCLKTIRKNYNNSLALLN